MFAAPHAGSDVARVYTWCTGAGLRIRGVGWGAIIRMFTTNFSKLGGLNPHYKSWVVFVLPVLPSPLPMSPSYTPKPVERKPMNEKSPTAATAVGRQEAILSG